MSKIGASCGLDAIWKARIKDSGVWGRILSNFYPDRVCNCPGERRSSALSIEPSSRGIHSYEFQCKTIILRSLLFWNGTCGTCELQSELVKAGYIGEYCIYIYIHMGAL